MRALFVSAALLVATPAAAQLAPVTVDHIDLVQSRPVTRTRYEYVYRLTVQFNGTPGAHSQGAHDLRAQITSSAAASVISDGDASFDHVLTGAKVTSTDTFSIIQDRTRPFDRSVLSYSFQYEDDTPVLPSFLGMTQAEAIAALAACCGASVSNFVHVNDPNAPPGTVVRTDPPAGTPLADLGIPPYAYVSDMYLSSGPDHTSQFGVTLASNELLVERGDPLPLQLHIDRAPGFTDPISLELEDPPTGYSANVLSVGPAYPTPRLTVFTSPSVYLFTELVVRASAGGQSVHIPLRVSPIPRSPSSGERIQSALAAGTINLETSYLYRMYSMMGDPRLPAELSGSRSLGEDLQLFRDIAEHEASFSEETRALLHPYLVRPSDPESFWSQPLASSPSATARSVGSGPIATAEPAVTILSEQPCPPIVQDPTWINKRVTAGAVETLLWVRCDPSDAEYNQRTLDTYLDALMKVLGPMTALMGPPLPDLGGRPDEPFDPDPAIDIYVMPRAEVLGRAGGQALSAATNAIGLTTPLDVGRTPKTSAWVQLDDEVVAAGDGSAHTLLIHELFHVLAYAHNWDQAGHTWISESCATWAETHFDFVVPWETRAAWLTHSGWFNVFRDNLPELALRDPDPDDPGRNYRAYIWFFFMQRVLGREQGAEAVAAMWRALETTGDVDAVLDGLFSYADHYPDFARLNVLTQDFLPGDPVPEDESYSGLDPSQFPVFHPFVKDDFPYSPSPKRHYIAADGGAPNDSSDPFDLKPLQTDYFYIDVLGSFTHEVDVTWDGPSPQDSLTVDSIARVRDGAFKVERVRTHNGITYCIPEGAEDQALLGYLIFSNGGYRPEQGIVQEKVTVTRRSTPTSVCGCTIASPLPGVLYCAEALRLPVNNDVASPPTSINHYGEIAGQAQLPTNVEQPVVWGGPLNPPVFLVTDLEKRHGSATRVNDAGQVAGYFDPYYPLVAGNAAFWPNDGGIVSPTFFPLPYPTPPAGLEGSGVFVALNNQEAVAYSTNRHVYIRQYDGASVSEVDAGPGDAALDLNEYNHVLIREGGRYTPAYPASDSLWKSGVRTPLPILAEALNDDDVVVGEWVDPASPANDPTIRPARWKDAAMTLLDLPPVPPPPQLYGPGSIKRAFATDINNRGEIVGYAFIHYPRLVPTPNFPDIDVPHGLHWARDGHVTDLYDVVPRNANVVQVFAINDIGSMAGVGIVAPDAVDCHRDVLGCGGAPYPVRLTPVRP